MEYPPPHQEREQHSGHLLRGGQYDSCVHAGGLSCYIICMAYETLSAQTMAAVEVILEQQAIFICKCLISLLRIYFVQSKLLQIVNSLIFISTIGSSFGLKSIRPSYAKDNTYSVSKSDDTCEGNLTQSDGYGEVRKHTQFSFNCPITCTNTNSHRGMCVASTRHAVSPVLTCMGVPPIRT